MKCGTAPVRIGIKDYMVLVTLYFVQSVLNNYAFNFNIPMPLHIIIKSVSKLFNLISYR